MVGQIESGEFNSATQLRAPIGTYLASGFGLSAVRRPSFFSLCECRGYANMARLPWFPLYVDDLLNDEAVRCMDIQTFGAYMKMLCFCWREGSVPADLVKLSRLIDVPYEEFKQMWPGLSQAWATLKAKPERMVNPRMKQIRDEQLDKHKRLSLAGEKGAKVKRDKALNEHQPGLREAEARLKHSESDTEVDTEKSKEKRKSAPSREDPDSELAIPEVLKGLILYEEDQKLLRRWAEIYPSWIKAYPGLDVLGEVKRAHAWEVDNPKKRKKDRPRFLGSWMSRAQDRRGGAGAGNGKQSVRLDAESLLKEMKNARGDGS